MDIKKTSNLLFNFAIKRLAEIFGIIIFIAGVVLLITLITYSPEDPNFIFPDNTEIKNLLGIKGSATADLFFQSLGLISILVAISLLFTGVNIIRSKKAILIIENYFYIILYTVIGSLFFAVYYPESFWLSIMEMEDL